jgi:hypothetical protein
MSAIMLDHEITRKPATGTPNSGWSLEAIVTRGYIRRTKALV